MFNEYIIEKLKIAKYKVLKDKTFFGEIPGLKGVWANSKNLKNCQRELGEVLEDWVILQIRDKRSISGLKINLNKKASLKNA